ncbi:MAG: hypothetical protein AAGJ31_15065 [Verrucomicrobiota bacterium]
MSFLFAIAVWAVIRPLVQDKDAIPGKVPGGGSASVTPTQLVTPHEEVLAARDDS